LELRPQRGNVVEIDAIEGRWNLVIRDGDATRRLVGDALVITGPGPPVPVCADQPQGDERVLDGREFWMQLDRFRDLPGRAEVCVIGTGETAAAIAVGLVAVLPEDSPIDIVSSHGVVYSRGESYEENRLFSDPTEWSTLTREHREEFIRRTDRAVFSMSAKAVLNRAPLVKTRAGRVIGIKPFPGIVGVRLRYGSEEEVASYQYVICAVGFDPLWFLELMTADARHSLEEVTGLRGGGLAPKDAIAGAIGHDLSVEALEPKLHLPMLAAMEQGPGFPNLSSLGLLSDRVLRDYCEPR
jgi:mycobactin lysine-N-oxygenase